MLSDILPQEAFGFLVVLTRMTALVMIMPAFGDQTVPVRVRVMLALAVSVVVYLSVRATLPEMPASVLALGWLVITELGFGLIVGGIARFLMTALHVAGAAISMLSGLAAAQAFDPAQGTQGAVIGSFLTVLGIAMIFATETHHLLIEAMVASYDLFPTGDAVPVADIAQMARDYVITSFLLGAKMSAPFILYSLVFYLGMGLSARMAPQMQIFFVAIPVNILLALSLLAVIIATMMQFFIAYMREELQLLLG